jgi:soluble lytic murein transglycosylase
MQLMPATARHVASKLDVAYAPERLTSNPEYNLFLGHAYLASLVERFSGSYVLALSAYNAGPSRAARWRDELGDPRRDVFAAIDWIEKIPFYETRNYVQRTLESLQVYRTRLNGAPVSDTLEADLVR